MDDLDKLVRAVLTSQKYRNVCRDAIASIGSRELSKRRNLREAIKATKKKLHQIGGAYLARGVRYAEWLDELRFAAASGDRDRFRGICIEIMEHHSSTRERLDILDQFYTQTLAELPHIGSVLDLACGLNPLAIAWMPLADDARYYAYDIYTDMVDFIKEFLTIAHVAGEARACDITRAPPGHRADLALILKSLPCIEQLDPSASLRLLDSIDADHLLISFPVRSLGGRDKQMGRSYETRFRALVHNKPWEVQRFEFATELAFLVRK
ncbi:MAG TPA: 16S rRNA methyltransferase [Anaerolineae bacterium]|nr:16S rRNA methyltransferase [Anaerolineae bacterium]